VNAVPGVVVEADDDAAPVKSLLVVVAKCKERKVSPVPGVVFVNADYT
jgi:hypothetical protein